MVIFLHNVYIELKSMHISRGHSRNQSKGERNSALTRFSDHLAQFMLTKSLESSSKTFICCIMYKTSLNHCFIDLKAKNNQIIVKKLFLISSKGGLATIRLARMTPDIGSKEICWPL